MRDDIAILLEKVRSLERKVSLLENQLTRALRLLTNDSADPNATIVKSRVILEKLIKDLYAKVRVEIPKKATQLGALLNNNQFTRHLPPRIVLRMNSVREYGNLAAHDKGPVTISDAIDCLKCLVEILDWYCKEYLDFGDDKSSNTKGETSALKEKKGGPRLLDLSEIRYFKSKTFALGCIVLLATVLAFGYGYYSSNRGAISQIECSFPSGLNQNIKAALGVAYKGRLKGSAPSAAIAILVKHDSNQLGAWHVLHNGDKLSPKDNYRIMFCPETKAYFYVIQIDSSGKLDWLFPRNELSRFSKGTNPVPARTWTYVPSSKTAFHLDENIGIEHIYVIVANSQWVELEKALTKACQSSGATLITRPFKLRTRGVGGTRLINSVPAKGLHELDEIRVLITGERGILVYERWFEHVASSNYAKKSK